MSDPLFSVANAFHCGSYQACVAAGADLEDLSSSQAVARDCFVYRAHLAMGSINLVLSEISDSAPTALQAVKLYAKSLSGGEAVQAEVLAAFEQLLADPAVALNPTVLLCCAQVHARAGAAPEALKLCHAVQNLELMALTVQILLSMDRPDAAERTAKAMAAVDDDATLSQLAGAFVALAQGGSKVTEAAYAFQEAGDKHGWSAKLHCAAAACHGAQGAWDDAERSLAEALACDGKDADVLASLVVTNLHLGRRGGAKLRAYLAQLKAVDPNHAFLQRAAAAETAFNAAAAAIAV